MRWQNLPSPVLKLWSHIFVTSAFIIHLSRLVSLSLEEPIPCCPSQRQEERLLLAYSSRVLTGEKSSSFLSLLRDPSSASPVNVRLNYIAHGALNSMVSAVSWCGMPIFNTVRCRSVGEYANLGTRSTQR